ncbi:MAG TPA: hypothetical protein VGG06_08245 [Thermoanaerobaculia bacterium]
METPLRRLARLALAAACLALAAAALLEYRGWRRERDELVALLREAGLATSGAIEQIRAERTSHHARIVAARALVYDVLETPDRRPPDRRPPDRRPPDRRPPASDRLPQAAALARQALRAQAGSWQAAMLLGAATYLEWSLGRDRRLYTEHAAWERPLRQALDQAPGQLEPRRFLAAAYLEVWPALSPRKRELTRELLAEAFRYDRLAFSTLAPVWLATAGDLDEALAIVPDRTAAWAGLEEIFAGRHEWSAFCRVHTRKVEALRQELEGMLAEAEERLRLGDYYRSRSLLLQVIARSPLDVRFAPLVTRALERYPPGLHGLMSTEPLREWLRWTLELYPLGRNPLPPPIVSRLAGAAGELEPPEAALAALVGGELHHAEQYELLADSLASEPWGPYLLAKAQHYLDRAQPREAEAALERTGRSTRRTLAYALTRWRVARARGDHVGVAEAERELTSFRRREWSAIEWQERGRRTVMPLYPETAAEGLAVRLNRVAAAGAVVEIRWDGASVALRPVPAEGEIEIGIAVTPELHLLELATVAGEQLLPGRVRLLPSPPGRGVGGEGSPSPNPPSPESTGDTPPGRGSSPPPRPPDPRRGRDPGS